MVHVVFTTILLIGALGLLAQLLLGGTFGHHGSHGHSHFHHGHRGAPQQGGSGRSGKERKGDILLSLLSPMTFFSICLGVGATGLLLLHLHPSVGAIIVGSATGGLLFNFLIVSPLMSTLLKFGSTPSKALEGSVAEPAEVITRFDETGKGMVNLIVDGQIVRVLATLEENDRPMAREIALGDRVLVTSIDSHTNACRVARI